MSTFPLEISTPSVAVPPERARSLRRFNVGMGLLHLVSGAAMVALSTDFTLPVSVFSLGGPPGTPLEAGTLSGVLDVPLAWATASFLFLSAFFHFVIASPWGFPRYVGELERGRNRFRWVEYSLSSTLMIVLIGLVTGITDLAALIGIAFANIAMILFGWLMEVSNNGLMHGSRPVAGPGRAGLVDTVLVRLRRRHRPVAGDRGVPVGLDRCARRPGPPGVRLGHPHQPVRAVQHLRAQPVAPVPPGRALARLPVR
jgi:hypothetical protein